MSGSGEERLKQNLKTLSEQDISLMPLLLDKLSRLEGTVARREKDLRQKHEQIKEKYAKKSNDDNIDMDLPKPSGVDVDANVINLLGVDKRLLTGMCDDKI